MTTTKGDKTVPLQAIWVTGLTEFMGPNRGGAIGTSFWLGPRQTATADVASDYDKHSRATQKAHRQVNVSEITSTPEP